MNSLIPPQDFAFYADESGISQDRFTVVGGICMHRSIAESVYSSISEYRDRHNMRSELKWSKISNGKLEEYRAFVDLFFALNSTNKIHFHCVIFDSHQWNHSRYNDGDADIGLSKLYYQLILHKFVKNYHDKGSLFVCIDHRNSSTSLHSLRSMLNSAAIRDLSCNEYPVKQVISRDSKKDDILQLNDVVLGSVCSSRNGKHLLSSTREAKRHLANYVMQKSGLISFENNSPPNVNRFTCWNFRARSR